MTDIEKVIEDGIAEILTHESIKAADGAIALQAFRMGNSGYQGEVIQVPLRRFADKIVAAMTNQSCPHFITPEGQARCKHCK